MADNNIGTLSIQLGVNISGLIEGMSKATYKSKQAAKEIGEAFKGMGHQLGSIFGQFGEIGNVIGETLGSAGETIAKFSGQLGSMSGMAGAAAIGVAALGAVAIATAVGIGKMAVEGAEYVHELSQVSQKTGIAIGDLQALKAAGATVGVGLDGMVTSFRKFDQALIGTGRSTGAAQATLRALGVTAKDNKEAMYQVADAFKSMENGPRKAADAIALFGRQGLALIPLLNKGSQGLKEFEAISEEFGPKIGKNAVDATEANEQYLMSQQKMKLAWDRLIVAAETRFLPVITKITTYFAEQSKNIGDLIDKLNTLPGALEIAARALSGLGHATLGTGDMAGNWDTISAIYHAKDASSAPKPLDNSAMAQRQLTQVKDEQTAKQEEYLELATKTGETELKYSYRALALLDQEQKIQTLKTQGKIEEAIAETAKLAPMRDAADLEKKQNELRRQPRLNVAGKDPTKEIEQALDREITKQSELAQSSAMTAIAIAVVTAEETKRAEQGKKSADLADEIVAKQQELAAAYKDPGRQSELSFKIDELKRYKAELDQKTPEIIAKAGAIALAGQMNKASEDVEKQVQNLEDQASAMNAVSDAYQRGYAAIRNAEIDKAIMKEKSAVDDARDAYNKFVAEHGELAGALSEEKTKLDGTKDAMDRARVAAGALIDTKLQDHINKETAAIEGEAAAWQIMNSAIGKGVLARIDAEEAAARARASADKSNAPIQIDLAGQQARQKAAQQALDTAAQSASQMGLVDGYKEEVAQLELIRSLSDKNASVILLANAKERDDMIAMNKQWDDAALKAGTFGQRVAATLNEVKMDGNDFWSSFSTEGLNALRQVEDGMAKLAIHGKANFKQIAQGLGEGMVKNGISGILSKGAGALMDKTGLGGLLPGFDKAQRDGKSEGTALYVELTKNSLGGMSGLSGGIGSLPLTNQNPLAGLGSGGPLGMLGTLGSMLGLPFMADGGDVTPGKAYVVGENHPEFFVPKTAGSIVPSMKMSGGGGSTQNHFHFHGVQDFDSFKKNQTQVAQSMSAVVGKSNGRR